MKKNYYNQVLGGAMMIMILTASAFAQLPEGMEYTFEDNAIENLKAGINSENLGLRKSAVYFAGKYMVDEVLLDLMGRLDKEDNAGVRILIAHSLYNIGDSRGIYRIKELAANDGDPRVRRMATALFNEYHIKSGSDYVLTR